MITAEPTPGERLRRLASLATGLLCAVLPAVRPLVWDGDPASPGNLAFLLLQLVAIGVGALEVLAGWRRTWRWGWGGVVLLALVLWLLPAAWRAPDQGEGWSLWVQLALNGALAAWLVQVAPGRERLILAGLLAGLGAEAAIALCQKAWVLPGIAVAQQSGAIAVAAEGIPAGDLAERVANGGLFGTFTLANTLAAYLILVLPPLLAAAWRGGSAWFARLAVAAVAVLALWALAGTSSKAAYLALAAASGLAWMRWRRGWTRWLPVPLALVAGAVLWSSPGLRAGLGASAEVRLGYWSGAARLVAEQPLAGHGLGAFAERSPGVMPLWAEPSRLVHNEVLEAAVSAGIPAALLLALLLAALVCRRPREPGLVEGATAVEVEVELPPPWAVGVSIAGTAWYLVLLGTLNGNLAWWPGGRSIGGLLGWGLMLGGGMAVLAALGQRLAPPPGRWWLLGLGAVALHSLVDFDLHAAALVGMVAVCAAVAGGARELRLAAPARAALPLAWGLLVAAFAWWSLQAMALRRAEDLVKILRVAAAGAPEQRVEAFAALAGELGRDEAVDNPGRAALWQEAWNGALVLVGDDPRRRLHLWALRPPSGERLVELEDIAQRLPASAGAQEQLARAYAAARRWGEAIAAQERAVACVPAHLPMRRQLAEVLEQAALAEPARAGERREQAARERRRIAELEPVVHPRNRGN